MRMLPSLNPEHFSRGDLINVYDFGIHNYELFYQDKKFASLQLTSSELKSDRNTAMYVLNLSMKFRFRSKLYVVLGEGYFLYEKDNVPLRLRIQWVINGNPYMTLGQRQNRVFKIQFRDQAGETIQFALPDHLIVELLRSTILTLYQGKSLTRFIIPGIEIKKLPPQNQDAVLSEDPPSMDLLEEYLKDVIRYR